MYGEEEAWLGKVEKGGRFVWDVWGGVGWGGVFDGVEVGGLWFGDLDRRYVVLGKRMECKCGIPTCLSISRDLGQKKPT